MRMTRISAAIAMIAPLLCASSLFGNRDQERDGARIKKALADKTATFWIYEDVDAGIAESRRTGKPLLVSIR